MAIFNSYVKLPEGKWGGTTMTKRKAHRRRQDTATAVTSSPLTAASSLADRTWTEIYGVYMGCVCIYMAMDQYL